MDTIPDPVGLLTALAALVPGAAKYLPGVLAYASLLGGVCVAFTVFVTPPASTAPAWWINTYRAISWIAGNLGKARNAAVPGMPAEVRDAALVSAKLAAAAPELTTVAVQPAIAGAVVPRAIETASDHSPPRVGAFDDAATRAMR